MTDPKGIRATIIADSVNPAGDRITTFLLRYPRFIHCELMTHRMFSRNAASSRAIPIEKTIEEVSTDPAGPIRWGKNGKGMQDHGVLDERTAEDAHHCWVQAGMSAITWAEEMTKLGLHKQVVNRVLEPFVWMTTLVTATEYDNFFALRVHKAAQPEFQRLAYLMLKEYLDHTPVPKVWDDWHLPFEKHIMEGANLADRLKIVTARCARLSYKTQDGNSSVESDFALHDRLVNSVPGHWSPAEHPARAQTGRFGPYQGWCSYRHTVPHENLKGLDLRRLLKEYEDDM